MSSTVIVGLSVLARETKKARILVLGYPIGHRPDPLRCAEELATIDVISRGRLDMGFIKGVPYEFPASNQNPVGVMDRFWEAHDFILKAMTSHDEPFNWEGEFFHYRQVNVWPRPVQQPHPPVWTTTGNKAQARLLGREGLRDGDARLGLRHAAALRRLSRRLSGEVEEARAGRPRRLSRTGRGRRRRGRSAPPRRTGRRLSALIGDRARAVPQSAGLPHRRRQRPHASRPERAAQLHQGRPRHQHASRQRAGPDRRRHPVLRHARPGLCADRRTSPNTAAAWATC